MADGDSATDIPTREELFLRAIDIVDEIEEKLDFLADSIRSKWQPADAELSDYARRVRDAAPYLLFRLLRQFNQLKDALRDSYDSLSETSEPES